MFRRLSAVFIASAALASMAVYERMPKTMAIHWNASGIPDGYAGRTFALAIIPLVMAIIFAVFATLRARVPEAAVAAYEGTGAVTMAFMLAVHAFVIAVGLGYPVRIDRVVPFAIAMLFVALGPFLYGIAPNPFVGVRTPWTKRDPKVWKMTHAFTGRFFVFGGLALAGACLAGLPFWGALAGFGMLAFVPLGYSYVVAARH